MTSKIKSIAEDANVSISSVSRVLNGKAGVAPELRARVMQSVEKLGYQPNLIARSLRMRRTFALGLVIPSITNPFFTNIARAVEDAALQAGYVVSVFSSDQNLVKEQRALELMCNRMVDGALVAVCDQTQSSLDMLVQTETPVVLLDRYLENAGQTFDRVGVDTRGGTYRAVEYLLKRGYRRIALIAGPQNVSTAVDKVIGYRQALTDNRLPLDENLLVFADYTEESSFEVSRRLLSHSPPPDAVIVSNNLMTIGFYKVVQSYKLRIPHEIALIGFDDMSWATLVSPPVTMIDQPTYDLGKTAVNFLLDRINGFDGPACTKILPTNMIIRGSS